MQCTPERSSLKPMKVMEQKIRSAVFLWPLSAFLHIFSFFRVCLCRHFVCFSPVSRPCTQILSLFILAAILKKFPLSVDESVMWFLLCARVFSPAAAIVQSEKTLGTTLLHTCLLVSETHEGLERVTRVQCSWVFFFNILGNLSEGYPFSAN